MGEVVRLNTNPGDEQSWWVQGGGDPDEAAAGPLGDLAYKVTNAEALGELGDALWAIVTATGTLDQSVTHAADELLAGIDFTDAAATVALIQDIRRRLQVVEQYLTKRLGENAVEVNANAGELPDGRHWEVKRGAVRKAWDHESWKHDARAKIVAEVLETLDPLAGSDHLRIVNTESGEEVSLVGPILQAVATATQEVHGSTAPKVTRLRQLGMDPDEYAESKAGLWRLAVASTDQTTTTEE